MFDYLKNRVSSAMQDINRALSSSEAERVEKLRVQIRDLELEADRKRARLEARQQQKLEILYPEKPVDGYKPGRFPDLHPLNFAERHEESWLVGVATGIIDNFPGSSALLSQLDTTLQAFSESNHLRVLPGGPYDELLAVRDRLLLSYGLEVEVPIYINYLQRSDIVGCSTPFMVLDHATLSGLEDAERDVLVAIQLGRIFFGNLKIFAFYRLMGFLDKLPSVARLLSKGLGMIPGIGNTISRGFELARSVNDNLIRKTNLVIGLQTALRCDRLAYLTLEDPAAYERLLVKMSFGSSMPKNEAIPDALAAQGQKVNEMFEAGDIDLHMMGVLGPEARFAAYRIHKMRRWQASERAGKIRDGFYVTGERVKEFQRAHAGLEKAIKSEEKALFDLEEQAQKLKTELDEILLGLEGEDAPQGKDAPKAEEA